PQTYNFNNSEARFNNLTRPSEQFDYANRPFTTGNNVSYNYGQRQFMSQQNTNQNVSSPHHMTVNSPQTHNSNNSEVGFNNLTQPSEQFDYANRPFTTGNNFSYNYGQQQFMSQQNTNQNISSPHHMTVNSPQTH